MPERFVILHHRVEDGEHWDLMLQHGETLATWQLDREPLSLASLPIAARRIGDHRIAYLELEGPLSGDRGTVRRVDGGTVHIEVLDAKRCVFQLAGQRLSGRFWLTPSGDSWLFASAAGSPSPIPR